QVEHHRLYAVGAENLHRGDPFIFLQSLRVDASRAMMPLLSASRESKPRISNGGRGDWPWIAKEHAGGLPRRTGSGADYPNPNQRVVKVVALDAASERVVKRVAQREWQRATFFTSIKFEDQPRGGEGWSVQAWLSDLAGRTKALLEEVASADLVVMVS